MHLYLIKSAGFIKIGATKQPRIRLKSYRLHNPVVKDYNRIWETQDAASIESWIKNKYGVDKSEWFVITESDYEKLVKEIENIIKGLIKIKLVGDETVWRKAIPIDAYDRFSGNFVARYPSISSAARTLNLDNHKITSCCRGKGKYSGNFIFRYAGDSAPTIDDVIRGSSNKASKPVVSIEPMTGKEVKVYFSSSDTKEDGYNPVRVNACVRRNAVLHRGLLWRYYEERNDKCIPKDVLKRALAQVGRH